MKSKRKDIPTFLLNINYVGIGRFILSCKADAGYIEEDTRYFINEFIKKHTEKTNAAFEFNILTLTKEQTRILHSLEYHKKLLCGDVDYKLMEDNYAYTISL